MAATMEQESNEHGALLVCDTTEELIDTGDLGAGLAPDDHGGACARLLSYLITESEEEETGGFAALYPNGGRWAGKRVAVTMDRDGREEYADLTDDVRDEFDQFFAVSL